MLPTLQFPEVFKSLLVEASKEQVALALQLRIVRPHVHIPNRIPGPGRAVAAFPLHAGHLELDTKAPVCLVLLSQVSAVGQHTDQHPDHLLIFGCIQPGGYVFPGSR